MSNAPEATTSEGASLPRRAEQGVTCRIRDLPALELLSRTNPAAATILQTRLLEDILNHASNCPTISDRYPANSLASTAEECEESSYDSDKSIVESIVTTSDSDNNFYGPPAHASAEQVDTNIEYLMQIFPRLLAAEETAMDPLSPRNTNAMISSVARKSTTKQDAADVAKARLAAAQKAQKEKDHAPAPPPMVYQPEGPSGEPAEKYRTGRLLGKGGFAICHEGELRGKRYGPRGYKFALKIVRTEMSQKRMQEKV